LYISFCGNKKNSSFFPGSGMFERGGDSLMSVLFLRKWDDSEEECDEDEADELTRLEVRSTGCEKGTRHLQTT
jgi:hypothetical protein